MVTRGRFRAQDSKGTSVDKLEWPKVPEKRLLAQEGHVRYHGSCEARVGGCD